MPDHHAHRVLDKTLNYQGPWYNSKLSALGMAWTIIIGLLSHHPQYDVKTIKNLALISLIAKSSALYFELLYDLWGGVEINHIFNPFGA